MLPFLLSSAHAVPFYDASDRLSGVEIVSFSVGGAGYHGVAMLDYDGDGDLDLYFANGPGQDNALFRNDGTGHFEEVARAAGAHVGTGTGGVLAADLDADGLPELVLAGDRAVLRTLRNLGDGTFEDATRSSGLEGARRNISANAGDVDGDGDIDVFVAGGIVPEQIYPNTLWLNNQDGTFTESAATAGVQENIGVCAAALVHLDDDQALDLLLAHCNDLDIVDTPIWPFRNRGDGTFFNDFDQARIWRLGHWMATAWLDYDRDGRLDVFLTNIGVSTYRNGPHALYRRVGDGTWEDVGAAARVADHPFGWGAVAGDFDNDGWEDLYYVGTAHGYDRAQSPGLYLRNRGDGTFADAEVPVDLSAYWTSGAAVGDVDGDGYLDVAVASTANYAEGAEGRPLLLLNRPNGNRSLSLRLVQPGLNVQGLGARVRAAVAGVSQVREVRAGDSYLSTSSPWVYFGLGADEEAEICVLWPDGTGESFGTLRAGPALHVLTRGAGVGPHPCDGQAPVEPPDTQSPSDTSPPSTDPPGETGAPPALQDSAPTPTEGRAAEPAPGCGCRAAPPPSAGVAALALLLLGRRRSRRARAPSRLNQARPPAGSRP